MEQQTNNNDMQFSDPNKEFIAKFVFSPDVNDVEADYSHLDKNIRLTNLQDTKKPEVSEVDMMRMVHEAKHVLNQPKHMILVDENKLIGYEEVEKEDKTIERMPVYENVKILKSKFGLTNHYWKSKAFSIETTASARNGWIYNKSRTQINEKSETLHDKTEVKKGFLSFGKQNQGEY